MADSFSTQVDKFVVDSEAKLLAVTQTAIESMIEESQTPVGQGGRMRVDTGFLRSSGLASLEHIPSGPGKGEKSGFYSWTGSPLAVVLAKMKIGDTFYWGWTANYAKYREAYDGFMEAALMNWQRHVDAAVAKLKGRMSK